jgi:hypothetical protein
VHGLAADLQRRGFEIEFDRPAGRILRSVVMKPESAAFIPAIHARLAQLSVE